MSEFTGGDRVIFESLVPKYGLAILNQKLELLHYEGYDKKNIKNYLNDNKKEISIVDKMKDGDVKEIIILNEAQKFVIKNMAIEFGKFKIIDPIDIRHRFMKKFDCDLIKFKKCNGKYYMYIEYNSDNANKSRNLDYVMDILYNITEKVLDGYWDYDLIDGTLYFSKRFWEMIGLKKIEDNKVWADYVDQTYLKNILPVFSDYINDKTDSFRTIIKYNKKNGEEYYAKNIGVKILTGDKITRFIGGNIDITNEIRQNEELDIEKKISQDAVDKLNSEILFRNKLKQKIHDEFKLKMDNMMSLCKFLEISEDISNNDLESVKLLSHNIYRMGKMLNSLSDTILIGSTDINLKMSNYSLKNLFKEVLTDIEEDINNKEITVLLPTNNHIIKTDKFYLKKCLFHVLDNAVRYSDFQSKIVIDYEKKNKNVTIIIKDFGRGISKDLLGKLTFNKQLYSDGTMGMGLYVTRNILDKMNSKISITSELGKGTTVKLVISPLQGVIYNHHIIKNILDDSKILYIEDESTNISFLEQVFRKIGKFYFLSSIEGNLGVELANTHKPLIIVLDLKLKNSHGIMVIKKLKELQVPSEIIVVSGYINYDITLQLKKLGVRYIFEKPLNTNKFIKTVKDIFTERKLLKKYKNILVNISDEKKITEIFEIVVYSLPGSFIETCDNISDFKGMESISDLIIIDLVIFSLFTSNDDNGSWRSKDKKYIVITDGKDVGIKYDNVMYAKDITSKMDLMALLIN